MKIQGADIHRFTVLKQATMEFSPAMNVFIGRNGAGKSHLMKLLYAIIKSLPPKESHDRERTYAFSGVSTGGPRSVEAGAFIAVASGRVDLGSREGRSGKVPPLNTTSTSSPLSVSWVSSASASRLSCRLTAGCERFNPNEMTAASKTLPFNTRVKVTNVANGKSVTVRINDRGPYVSGRCLDLSRAAFASIASLSQGVITVTYQIV